MSIFSWWWREIKQIQFRLTFRLLKSEIGAVHGQNSEKGREAVGTGLTGARMRTADMHDPETIRRQQALARMGQAAPMMRDGARVPIDILVGEAPAAHKQVGSFIA